jgi:hypothetical protein
MTIAEFEDWAHENWAAVPMPLSFFDPGLLS